jgi:hypothetical protein
MDMHHFRQATPDQGFGISIGENEVAVLPIAFTARTPTL